MRELAKITKLSPKERYEQSKKIIDILNKKNSLITIEETKKMDGYVLKKPKVLLKKK